MAIVTVCDKCNKILTNNIDEVELRFQYKYRPNQVLKTAKTITLCGDCFKELYGNQLEEFKKEDLEAWEVEN